MDIKLIQSLCAERKIQWSVHCSEKMHERGISRNDVLHCISDGEIIEDYQTDFPIPSCLIYGKATNNEAIHTVAGCDGNMVYIVTAYMPNHDKEVFESDLKTRKEK